MGQKWVFCGRDLPKASEPHDWRLLEDRTWPWVCVSFLRLANKSEALIPTNLMFTM